MNIKEMGFHFIVINLIRLLLIVEFFTALNQERNLVLVFSIFGFVVTFVPKFLHKHFRISTSRTIEVLIVLFIFGALFLNEVRSLYRNPWYDVLLNLVGAFALGLVSLSVLYAMYRNGVLNSSPLVLSFLVFSITLALAGSWEVFEFALDSFFGSHLQKSALDTMIDISVNLAGAIIVSIAGYFYVKHGKYNLVSKFFVRLVGRNIKHLRAKDTLERSEEEILSLIKMGESERLEFKSTLRTNLHTGMRDRKIELSALKTLCAFLNSNGGTLLVGVSDSGNVLGLENDHFENNDALKLHFTNLLKENIGNQFLPFIDFELFPVEDKHVLKVDCRRSDKRVFLKDENDEEFYVRNGPSSIKLKGNSMLEYIENRF